MTHTQRLQKVVKGEWLDRPAAAFWGPHLNYEEQNAHDLAYAMIANQEAYQWDFMKFDFSGMYFPQAFGQDIAIPMNEHMDGWVNVKKFLINHAKDWYKLRPLEVKGNPIFELNVEAVKRVADHFQGDVPILPTVFSPCSMAGEFVGGFFDEEKIVRMLQYDTKEVEYGLSVIEETLVNLMNAYVDAGAAGFFIGLQNGLTAKMGHEIFEKYEFAGTSRIVNAIKDKTWFNMAHLCNATNNKEMDYQVIEWCLDLPVTAINYSSAYDTLPDFDYIRAKTDKVLVGGIKHNKGPLDRYTYAGYYTPGLPPTAPPDFEGSERQIIKERLRARVEKAINDAGNKLVITGGCGCYEPHRFPVFAEVLDEIEAERAASHK
jgi:uroporphyrinogen decarboxylase